MNQKRGLPVWTLPFIVLALVLTIAGFQAFAGPEHPLIPVPDSGPLYHLFFGEPKPTPVMNVAPPVKNTHEDLCTGVLEFNDTVTRQILAEYVDGRAWQSGKDVGFLTRDDSYREINGEFLMGAGGRDPRDGCPYELIVFKGTDFAFAVKRDSAGLDGHYSVQTIKLYKEPLREIDMTFDHEGIVFHYEAVDGSEVEESIPFDGNFSVG